MTKVTEVSIPRPSKSSDVILGCMDILKMLADLRAERQQIEEAIITIERLAVGTRGKRRGRPPKWMAAVVLGGHPKPAIGGHLKTGQ